jgi:mono/diheme cytochrome c family protein
MRIFLKWLGISLAGLLGLAILAVAGAYVYSEMLLNRRYVVEPEAISIPTDAAAIERGRHIAGLLLCSECHGPAYSGTVWDEGAMVGLLAPANLTAGKGGVGADFSDADWVRAIRHGVDPDEKSLLVMPSPLYYHLSDEDLGALIAFLRTLPPVDNELPANALGPLGRYDILKTPDEWLSALAIPHDQPRPASVAPGVTAAYGQYLTGLICIICHGADLAGNTEMGAGANLTPAGNLSRWTEEQFITALRTGQRPNDKPINEELMPLSLIQNEITDDELRAIWLYLQTLPPVETPSE